MNTVFKKGLVFSALLFFQQNNLVGQTLTPSPTLPPEETALLDQGQKWVEENLKCRQFSQDGPYLPDFNKAPIGKCGETQQTAFGHYDQDGSLGLVLQVDGGDWMGAHEIYAEDEKFVFCHLLDGHFSAQTFTERCQNSTLELISFTQGPDLILVRDPIPYTEESNATVFCVINSQMKNVLTYPYVSICHQCVGGLETRLLPQKNRDLRLLTLDIEGDVDAATENYFGLVKAHVLEKIFHFDPNKESYQVAGPLKELPLVESVYAWFYEKRDEPYYSGPDVSIFDNKKNLEALFGYLRLNNRDPRWKFAHEVLCNIARVGRSYNPGQDYGSDIDLWKKWENRHIQEAGELNSYKN